MTPQVRKLMLTAHFEQSAGWATAAFLALAVTGLVAMTTNWLARRILR